MKRTLEFFKNHTTLILAIVSAYIYLCTYFFESGYLKVFDIPNSYLSIDLNTILLDSKQIIELIIATVFVYQLVKLPLRKWMTKSYLNDFFGSLVCRFAAMIIFARTATIIPNSWLKTVFFVWILVVIIIGFFILKTYFKKGKGVESDDQEEEDVEKPINKPPFYDQYFWVILLVLFPIIICNLLGEGIAAKATHFPMINDSTKYLVIRKYGDQLLCKDYDYINKKLGKQIIFLKIPLNKPVVLVDYEIGDFYDKKFWRSSTLPNKPALKIRPSQKVNTDTLQHH